MISKKKGQEKREEEKKVKRPRNQETKIQVKKSHRNCTSKWFNGERLGERLRCWTGCKTGHLARGKSWRKVGPSFLVPYRPSSELAGCVCVCVWVAVPGPGLRQTQRRYSVYRRIEEEEEVYKGKKMTSGNVEKKLNIERERDLLQKSLRRCNVKIV